MPALTFRLRGLIVNLFQFFKGGVMWHQKKVFQVCVVFLLPLLIISLTAPIISYAQSSVGNSVDSSLIAYENALSSSMSERDPKISSSVLSLIEERKLFYQKYFALGLNSELSAIKSQFDRDSLIEKKVTLLQLLNM